ncbi:hypothetical protein D3C78_1998230 [compost metagenome]
MLLFDRCQVAALDPLFDHTRFPACYLCKVVDTERDIGVVVANSLLDIGLVELQSRQPWQ